MENKTQTLDQTFNKTDFGHFIATNKTAVLVVMLVLFVGALGFSFYRNSAAEANQKTLNDIYSFNQTKLQSFNAKKMTKEELVAAYKALDSNVLKSQSVFPLATDVAMALKEAGDVPAAIEIMAPVLNNFSTSNYGYYFAAVNLAALYEDNNELDKAISTLENLTKAKVKIMEAKTYFDLGRIYKVKGDVNNARLNFNYVISNFAQDDFAKLSKIYLMEME